MPDVPWWKSAVIYEIYPRSFQDTDADGVGDLRGIIARLPYLVDLGVDAIWICPIFPSPMADFGYDVASYVDIDPLFGTLHDFDVLLTEAHRAGLKVLLDLVPNHTSDRHPWFVESRGSRDNTKRDWYLWRDGRPGGAEPNNWLSEFGGSAWELDPRTGQYYYHAFLKQQPDLNWRNAQVRRAIYEAMRFWLRRGVDGFRVDVLWHLIKDDQFRDNPANPNFLAGHPPHEALIPVNTTDRPEMAEVMAEMRDVVDEFGERLLIGEIYLPESTTPSSSAAIRPRSITSIAGSSLCGDHGARSCAAAIARSMPTAICWCSVVSRVKSVCWSRSISEWPPRLRSFPTSLPERSCCNLDRQGEDARGGIELRPDEGVVIEAAGKAPRQ